MDNRAIVLDIAMNLNRIGSWAADNYAVKKKRIELFLDETSRLVESIDKHTLSRSFEKTLSYFLAEYQRLKEAGIVGPKDTLSWAEEMMTWGNILTHRVKLIEN